MKLETKEKIVLPSQQWRERISEKMLEAQFFLTQMKQAEQQLAIEKNENTVAHFLFYTSAFISAIKQPQRYMLESWALLIPGSRDRTIPNWVPKGWYDNALKTRPLLDLLTIADDADFHSVAKALSSNGSIASPQWPGANVEDKSITAVAELMLQSLRSLIDEGIRLGHL